MISAFRLSCAAALTGFIALGAVRRHGDGPLADPATALVDHIRARGYDVSAPQKVLWGVPGIAISVAACPQPIDALVFEFDEIMSPGILAGVRAADPGILQVSYEGETFSTFDRAALYRLRLTNGLAEFVRTGQWVDPPVILLFWPAGCAQTSIL
jgi:hypothetical protein